MKRDFERWDERTAIRRIQPLRTEHDKQWKKFARTPHLSTKEVGQHTCDFRYHYRKRRLKSTQHVKTQKEDGCMTKGPTEHPAGLFAWQRYRMYSSYFLYSAGSSAFLAASFRSL